MSDSKSGKTRASPIAGVLRTVLFVLIAYGSYGFFSDQFHGRPFSVADVPSHRLTGSPDARPSPDKADLRLGNAPVVAWLPKTEGGGEAVAVRWSDLGAFRKRHPDASFRLPVAEGAVNDKQESGFSWRAEEREDGLLVNARRWQETADFRGSYLVRPEEIRLITFDHQDAGGTVAAVLATALTAGLGAMVATPMLLAILGVFRKAKGVGSGTKPD